MSSLHHELLLVNVYHIVNMIKALTTSALKGSCNKAVLSVAREIVFSNCPKCGLRTMGTIGDISFCLNCEDE